MSKGQLILVVDDDTDLVEMVSMKLESEDFRVAKAYDGVEAMDKIKAGEITLDDIVTTSAHASRMGGSQVYLATSSGIMASYDNGLRFTRSTGNLPEGACLDMCLGGQVTNTTVYALMGNHGIAARMFSALATHRINIVMITLKE